MGVDNNSLLRVTSQEIINGLNQDGMGAMADVVCSQFTRSALKGTEPYRASADTVPRDIGGQAVGADIREREFAMSSLDWDMLQYDEKVNLTTQQIEDIEQYQTSTLQRYLATLRRDVNISIDADLQTLLTAETNTKAAGNGAWSVATSTPTQDIQDGIKTYVPGADMLVVGVNTAYELSRHDELKERSSNYSGSGSMGFADNFQQLRGVLGEITGVNPESIYIAQQFYNTANPGQTLSLSHLFGDFFWAGFKEGLVKVEQKGSGEVTTKEEHNRREIAYIRTLDLIRVDDFLGLEFTGI